MNALSSLLMPAGNNGFETTDVILHIEDSEIDHEALKRAYSRAGIKAPLFWCTDVNDAQDYLSHAGRYQLEAKAPRPAIILLDLNMPGEDGITFLKKLKSMSKFSSIPVVVLSSSSSPTDVERCYKLGANAYLLKPMDPRNLDEIVQAFTHFWLKLTVLPQRFRNGEVGINDWDGE